MPLSLQQKLESFNYVNLYPPAALRPAGGAIKSVPLLPCVRGLNASINAAHPARPRVPPRPPCPSLELYFDSYTWQAGQAQFCGWCCAAGRNPLSRAARSEEAARAQRHAARDARFSRAILNLFSLLRETESVLSPRPVLSNYTRVLLFCFLFCFGAKRACVTGVSCFPPHHQVSLLFFHH